jgi:hypothetical protein
VRFRNHSRFAEFGPVVVEKNALMRRRSLKKGGMPYRFFLFWNGITIYCIPVGYPPRVWVWVGYGYKKTDP